MLSVVPWTLKQLLFIQWICLNYFIVFANILSSTKPLFWSEKFEQGPTYLVTALKTVNAICNGMECLTKWLWFVFGTGVLMSSLFKTLIIQPWDHFSILSLLSIETSLLDMMFWFFSCSVLEVNTQFSLWNEHRKITTIMKSTDDC